MITNYKYAMEQRKAIKILEVGTKVIKSHATIMNLTDMLCMYHLSLSWPGLRADAKEKFFLLTGESTKALHSLKTYTHKHKTAHKITEDDCQGGGERPSKP